MKNVIEAIKSLWNFISAIFNKKDEEVKKSRKEEVSEYTLAQMKELWQKEHYPKITEAGALCYEFAWKKIPEEMKEKKFLDLTYADWQSVVDEVRKSGLSFSSQKRIKNFCGQLYKCAIKEGICEKNFAYMIEMSKNIPVVEKTVFTSEELKKLWTHKTSENVMLVLILIYTGVRVSELLRVRREEDVFLADNYFIIRQSKTYAGTNRPIPIHKFILPFIKYFYELSYKRGSVYLFCDRHGEMLTYRFFRYHFKKVMERFGFNHTIHECRHTFASLLDDNGANEMCIKKILGHAGFGVTKKVYTHKNLEQLFEAINTIKKKY